MTALAAARLGYQCHIYTPEHDSPASKVSAVTTVAAYDDRQALAAFAAAVDVVTLEFENIPLDALAHLESLIPLRPGPKALEIGQDRIFEKTFFGDFAQTAPWRAVGSLADLQAAIADLGCPAILKTCRLGYDGKGQFKIERPEQAAEALSALGLAVDAVTAPTSPAPLILEGFVAFEREVSVIVARSENGQTAAYPVVENVHRNHILDTTTAPAEIDQALAQEAHRIATTAVERLGLVGLLAVELFVTKDAVVVNEMAPRPHNSGHWTMDAGLTDQFEQLVRAVCGLPLGDCKLHYPVVMKNLLGNDGNQWQSFLADSNARLHLYGKAEARAGRKMGHVNFIKAKG
jgi:5-(carboxyamino)imidazole ribonucleotide synthase